jgi:hypothetical protein
MIADLWPMLAKLIFELLPVWQSFRHNPSLAKISGCDMFGVYEKSLRSYAAPRERFRRLRRGAAR